MFLPQTELTPERLTELLDELFGAPERLVEMAERSKEAGKPDAVRDITDALEQEVSGV